MGGKRVQLLGVDYSLAALAPTSAIATHAVSLGASFEVQARPQHMDGLLYTTRSQSHLSSMKQMPCQVHRNSQRRVKSKTPS